MVHVKANTVVNILWLQAMLDFVAEQTQFDESVQEVLAARLLRFVSGKLIVFRLKIFDWDISSKKVAVLH